MPSDANEKALAAGQGKLAEVIASRGGHASPETPFVIEQREALIYMLCEAAELEHGLMCQYTARSGRGRAHRRRRLAGCSLRRMGCR